MEPDLNKTQEFSVGELDKIPDLNTLKGSLEKLAYWGRFFGVLAYVFFGICCIILLYFLLEGDMFIGFDDSQGSVVGMIIGLFMYYFSAKYLYDFSKETYVYLKNNNLQRLENGLSNLASMFKLYGVIVIVYLVFLGIFLLFFGSFILF